uniref:Uncharacterized protein n=1 Tax=Rhodopseudomonas palustris (strain BisA53) TaxID=316055 RepID=Q07KS4_RHOP5
MARERNPNDPYYQDPAANDLRRSARLDQELQAEPDPIIDREYQAVSEPTENRISGGRIAAAIAAVVVLIGALYYGMNMSSTTPTSTATQTDPASPAVRDVTPNRDASTTTGSAPASPQTPASPPSNSSTTPAR